MSKDSTGGPSRRLFYFALPPSVYPPVCKMIKTDAGGWTRVLVEKPFGRDLQSAEELSTQIGELFDESQIYRIDHYLGKELVLNLLVLRFANRLFLPLWNHGNISSVQYVASEAALPGCNGEPVSLKPEHIQDEKVKVLELVLPVIDEEVVIRQYEGYKDDPTVPKDSNTPTFATMVKRIHNARWECVGKSLNSRKAEIRVQFKDVPGGIYSRVGY
ncbi:hypothetical protein L1887_36833 [Cichorium endivia]|nr:hypothetical protein L1887_36833 [Cichorium endivia]